ncbi:MAG: hypothetical protein MUO54_01940 [Anaerolineales bacterium]|nr:hypothetical protein [Anaerolineales bacterium]
MTNQPFIRGEQTPKPFPLEEFLPTYRSGVVSSWLKNQTPQPDLVLSPFGDSPQEALEAAAAGYRVIVPIHNPISRFLLKRLTQPISRAGLNSALAQLASSYKGKERLKPFILSLYETDCPQCGKLISAKSFTWSRSKGEPIQKSCLCSECGETSNTPVTPDDIQKALGFTENSPSHARALTRVAPPNDPVRFQAENALRTYPPRTVYALFTLLNKFTGFDLSAQERISLEMLLLHAFYRCSSLSPSSDQEGSDSREENIYLEENVWFALEEALEVWEDGQSSIPLTTWPELPPASGGISIYPGRVMELLPQIQGVNIDAALLVFPKPNLSFWALSALWTGWLWGQEAAAPLRNILSMQNLDWVWLTRAIKMTLTELRDFLPSDIPCFGLLPDLEINYLLSVGTAALSTGFDIKDIAVDPDLKQAQMFLSTGNPSPRDLSSKSMKEIIRSAGFEFLKASGEPKHSFYLYSAGLVSIASENPFGLIEDSNLEDIYKSLVQGFEESIAYRQGFLHYLQSETWWHQELNLSPSPLSDQVEMALVNFLTKSNSSLPEINLYGYIYNKFPGIETPRQGLIEVCLKSYAEKINEKNNDWILKSSDQPVNRRQDIKEIEGILSQLGGQLGFETKKAESVGSIVNLLWFENDHPAYTFYISASGVLNNVLTGLTSPNINPWFILPGSRAELIHYKMQNNKPLADLIQSSWGLIKYRHIRRMADEGGLTRDNLQERLALDPFTTDAPQLPLI